jgi:hypothetical protein
MLAAVLAICAVTLVAPATTFGRLSAERSSPPAAQLTRDTRDAYDSQSAATTPRANTPTKTVFARSDARGRHGVVRLVSGYRLAAKGGAEAERVLPPLAGGAPLLGEGGTQVTSATLLRDTGQGFRIDVENPAPGFRPGQLHLQDTAGGKYLYDFDSNEFVDLPRSLAKKVADNPDVARAISKGRDYLNVEHP